MSSVFGVIDDRDALCIGCKNLPTVDQLTGYHHMIHDCFKEFSSCNCPLCICIWLRENRRDVLPWKLEEAVKQVSVDIVVFPDTAGNRSLHLNLMYKETTNYFHGGSTKFDNYSLV